MKKQVVILGIESSCDETAASVLAGRMDTVDPNFKSFSTIINSQAQIHAQYGGVVPEMAARNHIENIGPVVAEALKVANKKLNDLDYIAVTSGPGLIPSLIVGVEYAKGLAYATKKLLLPTNHMEGHLYSAFQNGKTAFPLLSLIVSGGHTMLVLMTAENKYKVIGQTVDDAVGEAFDKVGKMLGLPYPGGPEVSKIAAHAKKEILFTQPMLHSGDFNFSFSGLKTAVRQLLQKEYKILTEQDTADICAGFQNTAIGVLSTKTFQAAKKYKVKTIALGGGVSANKMLRETLAAKCAEEGLKFLKPPHSLCTDNAEMIAMAAYFNLRNGSKGVSPLNVKADPNWEIV
ncbi:MAG TPA: tRNA (adenosine(37)-N6)-threonylcarbamoyltransferase complex transferase subunit TsaD [Patescibacteria group bacterium]|nr:tRNA (adenosine(37)-N6)-threonylcarbamoyltransferase complex transferase subunit TsaD [Patescibacteria group bacterium]